MRKLTVLLILALLLTAPLVAGFAQDPLNKVQVDPNNAKVDALYSPFNKTDSPGLAVAVIKDGKTVFQRGYGMANLEFGVSITTATVFCIASLTKQFTAFCILLLCQGGKLTLDDDIRKHIAEVPDFGKKITVRHLIHHTSGLRDYLFLASLAGRRGGDIITESDLLDVVRKQKELNFEPGSEFDYCNTGYELLALIVKRVSGKSLRDYAQKNVFEPLAMRHSQFRDDHLMMIPNTASSYLHKPNGWKLAPVNLGVPGAGNVHTTVEDLALWDRNFYDARVGGQKVIEQMHETFTLTDGTVIDYAGGLTVKSFRGLKTVEHTGSAAGYITSMLRFPEQKFSVFILGNGGAPPKGAGPRIVADIYLAKEFKEEKAAPKVKNPKPKPANPPKVTEEQRKEYVGSFYSEELELMFHVTNNDSTLTLRHRKGEFPIVARSADEFSGHFSDYVGEITLRFTRNAQKQVNGLTIDANHVRHLKLMRAELKLQK